MPDFDDDTVMGDAVLHVPSPVLPGFDDFYVAETIEGVTLNCTLCGEELLMGYTLIFSDLLVAITEHNRRPHTESPDHG